ncbi:MAG: phosphoadenylyl-sulfate reductase [Alphaproteobacteria bacterium]|jgi:phosphoadenosine phosphosulfate reductase|nr:phosphoadenylyl-sulfate reductase [Alphaproteobacteria bacterium]
MSIRQDIQPDPSVEDRSLAARNFGAWRMGFGRLDGEELLAAMVQRAFPGQIALVSSFGAEAALLLAMLADIDRQVPIIFLDTGKHFPETLTYRDILIRRFGFTDVRSIRPNNATLSQSDPAGDLWRSDPDRCCHLRKVLPLTRALTPFQAWITGRKRFHGGGRAALPAVEYVADKVKVNPLANWTPDQVNTAFRERGLPGHPLVGQGYPSIGCATCTRASAGGIGSREGRWAEQDKTECGIHI